MLVCLSEFAPSTLVSFSLFLPTNQVIIFLKIITKAIARLVAFTASAIGNFLFLHETDAGRYGW